MNTALTTTIRPVRTRPPATWAGLRAVLVGTQRVADALAETDPASAAPEVAALCAQAVETLAAARPQDEIAAPVLGISQVETQELGQAAAATDSETDLAGLVAATLNQAVAVLDNHDEPLNCAETVAISRTVTALCSARIVLAGVIR